MELIHVITTDQKGLVSKIESFAVVEEQLKNEVNEQAENAFVAEAGFSNSIDTQELETYKIEFRDALEEEYKTL